MIEFDILNVLNQLRDEKIKLPKLHPAFESNERVHKYVANMAEEDIKGFRESETIIDVTNIYNHLDIFEIELNPYDKYTCIAPPWEEAIFCYKNTYGNVIIIRMGVIEVDMSLELLQSMKKSWITPNKNIDWNEAKWLITASVWAGGYSKTLKKQQPYVIGPVCLVQYLVEESGKSLDLHWQKIADTDSVEIWEVPSFVLLQSLNFLNCRNVEIAIPKRKKNIARRLEQSNTKLHTITVKSVSKSSRGNYSSSEGVELPLHTVRGHFAEYGPKYGKGKLFGRLEGRFWIPQHGRGVEEKGKITKNFRLEL